jgi:hypothetical protein
MAKDLGFVPEFDSGSCKDTGITGQPSTKYDYVLKATNGDKSYPATASVGDYTTNICRPYLHYNVNMGNLKLDENIVHVVNITSSGNINISGTGNFGGTVTAPTFVGNLQGVASGNKAFDIPHVKEKGKRIRHICAEGPESGIYIRGRLKDTNIIPLPDYWDGLVDKESITVTLTQIGYPQDLIVEENIEWGKTIYIRSGNGANINCYYEVWAARHIDPQNPDEKLHVVYDGESPADYPGNNDNFIVGGF